MKINWGRLINAGLIAEISLLFVFQMAIYLQGRGLTSRIIVVLGSFLFMLVAALWVGRKIESHFLLHGLLVGVVAVIYYVIESLPNVLNGQYPNYFSTALIGHTPKLLGGIVGGYIAGRRKTKAI
jgi:hypothetical protein